MIVKGVFYAVANAGGLPPVHIDGLAVFLGLLGTVQVIGFKFGLFFRDDVPVNDNECSGFLRKMKHRSEKGFQQGGGKCLAADGEMNFPTVGQEMLFISGIQKCLHALVIGLSGNFQTGEKFLSVRISGLHGCEDHIIGQIQGEIVLDPELEGQGSFQGYSLRGAAFVIFRGILGSGTGFFNGVIGLFRRFTPAGAQIQHKYKRKDT